MLRAELGPTLHPSPSGCQRAPRCLVALPVCVSFEWDVLCDRARGFWGRMEKLGETSISMDVGKTLLQETRLGSTSSAPVACVQ